MWQNLNPLYWFSFQPARVDGVYGKIVLGFFLVVFMCGIVSRIVITHRTHDRYVKRIAKRFSTFLFTMGFFGIVLYFFSYEQIRFFGGRFWYPLWDIGFLVWLGFLVKFVRVDLPRLRERDLREHAKSKYFPKRRHSL